MYLTDKIVDSLENSAAKKVMSKLSYRLKMKQKIFTYFMKHPLELRQDRLAHFMADRDLWPITIYYNDENNLRLLEFLTYY